MALAARVAEELKALDVRKGDRVGLAATAGMEYCAAAYATWEGDFLDEVGGLEGWMSQGGSESWDLI